MWYRKAKHRLAQTLNIPGPLFPVGTPPAAPPPAPDTSSHPALSPDPNQTVAPPAAPPTALLPPQIRYTGPLPPLHENCHCEIRTLPGGRQTWEATANACPDCQRAAQIFNAIQARLFGI